MKYFADNNNQLFTYSYDELGRPKGFSQPFSYLPLDFNTGTTTIMDTTYYFDQDTVFSGSNNNPAYIQISGIPGSEVASGIISEGVARIVDGSAATESPINGSTRTNVTNDPESDELVGSGYIQEPKYINLLPSSLISLENISNLNSASIILKTSQAKYSELNLQGMPEVKPFPPNENKITVKGIKENGSVVGVSVTASFSENNYININITSILNYFLSNNLKFNGIRIDGAPFTTLCPANIQQRRKAFFFSFDEYNPLLIINSEKKSINSIPYESHLLFSYYDNDNKFVKNTFFNAHPDSISNGKILKTETQYNAKAQISQVKVNNTIVDKREYDNLDRLMKQENILKVNEYNKTEFEYNSFSELVKEIQNDISSTTIDESIVVTDNTTLLKKVLTDPSGYKIEKYYDGFNNLIKEIKKGIGAQAGIDLITKYEYSQNGRLSKVISPENKITTYDYDSRGNLIKRITPSDGTNEYKYNNRNNLRFEKNNSTRIKYYSYDGFNRLVGVGELKNNLSELWSALNANINSTFTARSYYVPLDITIPALDNMNAIDTSLLISVNQYDSYSSNGVFRHCLHQYQTNQLSAGNITATAFRDMPGEHWSYKVYYYDALGRVSRQYVQYRNIFSFNIYNEYDDLNNITKQSIVGPSNLYVWYDYDINNRLISVKSSIQNNKGTAVKDIDYNYNENGAISKITYPFADDNSNINGLYSNYLYDTFGRITKISSYTDDKLIFDESLSYFANSNINNMFITNKANPGWPNINSIFGYDSYNRLKSHVQYYPNNASKTMNYTYDKDGNILTYQKLSSNGTDLTFFTMTYNSTSGRLQNLKKGTTNYSYSFDVNGNIINDYHRQLEISKYNSLNLIKEMRKDNGDGDIIKYDYDESGNRIAKYYQSTKEYYLRDHLGKELAVYDLGHPIKASKFFNLYGANGLAGRIETNYTSEQIYSRGGWITQWLRDDERFY
ncbi:MAG: hypothetical protein K8F60_18680, partial [Melioribacteraceae bacterium]|nr:hypothetical protein [Melioribacteraceae bacterium]